MNDKLLDIIRPGYNPKPKTQIKRGSGKKSGILAQIRVIGTGDPDLIELRVHCPMTVKKSEVTGGAFAQDGNNAVARALEHVAKDFRDTSPENFYNMVPSLHG